MYQSAYLPRKACPGRYPQHRFFGGHWQQWSIQQREKMRALSCTRNRALSSFFVKSARARLVQEVCVIGSPGRDKISTSW